MIDKLFRAIYDARRIFIWISICIISIKETSICCSTEVVAEAINATLTTHSDNKLLRKNVVAGQDTNNNITGPWIQLLAGGTLFDKNWGSEKLKTSVPRLRKFLD